MDFAVFGMMVADAAWRRVKLRSRGDAAMTEFADLFSALEAPPPPPPRQQRPPLFPPRQTSW